MANSKISALTAATTPLAGTEVLPVVQSGVTKQVSVANLTAGRAVSADSLALTGSPLPATSGGTGQSSYAVGDLLYASTTTALSKLADVATGNALISGGVGVAPSWGKIGLTTHVSGTLPVGNGGTGLTAVSSGYIPYGNSATALTTSGDLTFVSNNLEVYTNITARNGSGNAVFRLRTAATDMQWTGISGSSNVSLIDNSTGFTLLNIGSTTDVTVNRGNLVVGTAGKGIDFTAGGIANGVAYLDGSKLLASFSSNFKFDGTTLDLGNVGSNGRLTIKAPSGQRAVLCYNSAGTAYFYTDNDNAVSTGANGADAVLFINKITSNSRSVNAAGTLNASGADYAEYMVKAGDILIAKGELCGVNAEGKLTNVFADSVSFVVKSSDPSFVGGDTWGADLEGDDLEAARQKVDRIAFAGQVPINIKGATPGQYIVPTDDNGAIKPTAVDEANMTLAMYMRAVGKVIATELDGRAKIIVKTA